MDVVKSKQTGQLVCWYCDGDPCECKFEAPRGKTARGPEKPVPEHVGRAHATAKQKQAKRNKWRREKLDELGLCMNGPLPDEHRKHKKRPDREFEHGPRVPGNKKCRRCIDIHKKSRGYHYVPKKLARAA